MLAKCNIKLLLGNRTFNFIALQLTHAPIQILIMFYRLCNYALVMHNNILE